MRRLVTIRVIESSDARGSTLFFFFLRCGSIPWTAVDAGLLVRELGHVSRARRNRSGRTSLRACLVRLFHQLSRLLSLKPNQTVNSNRALPQPTSRICTARPKNVLRCFCGFPPIPRPLCPYYLLRFTKKMPSHIFDRALDGKRPVFSPVPHSPRFAPDERRAAARTLADRKSVV